MNASKIEIPEDRIVFSLLCGRCGERVDRQVNEDCIPESLRCCCGNYLSLTGEADSSPWREPEPEMDMEPVAIG